MEPGLLTKNVEPEPGVWKIPTAEISSKENHDESKSNFQQGLFLLLIS